MNTPRAALRAVAAMFLLILVTGCISSEQLEKADYGPRPTNVDQELQRWLQDNLRDPDSALVKKMSLQKGACRYGRIYYGWVLHAQINGKNAYGGYAGYQDYFFIYQGNTLVQDIPADVWKIYGQTVGMNVLNEIAPPKQAL